MPRDPYRGGKPTPPARPAVEVPTLERCPLCAGHGHVEPVLAELFRESCRQIKEDA